MGEGGHFLNQDSGHLLWYSTAMNKLPEHMSYSSLTTWLDCGWRYYLTKVEGRTEKHSLWLTAGTAVHLATESWDRNRVDPEHIWNFEWKLALEEDIFTHGDPSNWDYKPKENEAFWFEEGLAMLERWVSFRSKGWEIHEDFIEKEYQIPIGESVVKMAIDRVMVDPEGKVVLLDIKTGASPQKHPLQLAVYAWALAQEGIKVDKAGFWEARTGVLSLWDIDYLHAERVEDVFKMFEIARGSGVFIPNLSACGRCGVIRYCKWINGKDAENG